jgi:toxin ParE1/3/4
MGYRLSRKAEDDLIDIYLAGARDFGAAQAERYYFELQDVFEFLSRFPQIARGRTEIERRSGFIRTKRISSLI